LSESAWLLLLQFAASLAGYVAVGWWFIRPWLQGKPARAALSILLLPQLFRHVGVTLLSEEVVDPTLPEAFARQTAAGDTLAALLAWGALIALRAGWRHALAAVWIFNVVGLTDMLVNLAHGARLQTADHLGAAWFGVAFVVPAMLVVHSLIFAFLLRARRERSLTS
jgi:tellurite resistance protein TehA-like permease